MNDPRTRFDLIGAFAREGCAVCRLVDERIDRQIDTLNYECVMDPDIRAKVKDAAGFCVEHAHRWQRTASVLATAQIYADITQRGIDELERLSFVRRGPMDKVRGREQPVSLLEQRKPCLICASVAESETHMIKVLLDSIGDLDFAAAFGRGTLCIPHSRRAFALAPNETAFNAIRERLLVNSRTHLTQLREIVRKHDHRFKDEPSGDEVGAGKRVVRMVAGEPNQV